MDYLDPKQQSRHQIILFVGYGCIAIAIAIATLVLVYQAYGFGLDRKGTVIQNGLTFFSSQPNPATITVNGVVSKSKTNSRLVLPENIYQVVLSRDGYRNWERTIQVDGGSVRHFDYPMLFPKTLTTKKIDTFSAAPGVATQSPDRRWLMTQQAGSITSFNSYDLKNPTKAATAVTVPDTVLSKPTTGQESWRFSEWADDNVHLVLEHVYDDKSEYVLINRENPEQSINLNTTISGTFTKLTLNNRKFDQYYVHDTASGALQTASLQLTTPTALLPQVLAYKSYGDNTVLYASTADSPAGKVVIRLRVGDKTYDLRTLPAGTTYLLDLTKYDNNLYVVLGASSQNKLFIYKDPIGQLVNEERHSLSPAQVLHVVAPNYLSFSSSAQYIVAENGTQFGVYDIENEKGYNYTAKQPLDAPAAHATWMDGNRLTYVSGGKMTVFDYDYTNHQSLMAASSTYLSAYAPDYKFIYALTPGSGAGQFDLMQTSLNSTADQ
ncbi:MAG: hypothetical protein JWO35_91 [Candidatus Saccharibacteria bacterium]|nr:hypothetical protein [Candidatus Saccharibacteria bacterium]